jgi:DNA-binding NtrC family response regulator
MLSDQPEPAHAGPRPIDEALRSSIQVLVVDDEHTLRESCGSLLRSEGFQVTVCGRGDEAVEVIRRKAVDILLVDLHMSQVSGMQMLQRVKEISPATLVIVMTGHPTVESSIGALRAGAWEYLPKPFSATHLQILMGRASHTVLAGRWDRRSRADLDAQNGHSEKVTLLGRSASMRRVIDIARKVAATDASVFLTGESGTGKEIIAQFIHAHSRRCARELVPINCAAIPEALLESEMFGHVAGAFTGAVKDKEGLLQVAHGGSLFLDEITEMPLPVQAKLLRVVQDGVLRRVGSTKTDAIVNVRFIAATNVDPRAAVRDGRLRKDLHFRLGVLPIHIPPLRDRPEDVPVLAEHFLHQLWALHRDPDQPEPRFTAQAMAALRARPWPGNVRELRNLVEHAVVMMDPGREIDAADLPVLEEELAESGQGGFVPGRHLFTQGYHRARATLLGEFEKDYIRHVVREAQGNISDAARMAEVDRTTLYRLMEKHGQGKGTILSGH